MSPSFKGQEVQKTEESMRKFNWHSLQKYINNQQPALLIFYDVLIQSIGDVSSPILWNTSPTLWITTHHTSTLAITLQTLNNFNAHDFSNHLSLAYIYIT
jgi:hypothetical protein